MPTRLLALAAALLLASPALAQDPYAARLGSGPLVPAGAPAASLGRAGGEPGWTVALASGLSGRFGGERITRREPNSTAMIYLGLQADGHWPEGHRQASRFRVRLLTGGENDVFVPTDGELEGAYLLGRPEFRFVVARVELLRYPSLGLEVLGQVSTLPSVEGSISLAGDAMRFDWLVAPVQVGYAYYYGGAHIDHSAEVATESDAPFAASAARLRYTLLLPGAVVASVQGDLLKAWSQADLLAAGEGSLGYAAFESSIVFNAGARLTTYRRRGPEGPNATERATDLKVLVTATARL